LAPQIPTKYCNFCGNKVRKNAKEVNGFIVCKDCKKDAKCKQKKPEKKTPFYNKIANYLFGVSIGE